VLLRDHPLMSWHGIPSWPPKWVKIKGPAAEGLTGEIGILTRISVDNSSLASRCFLYMHHEESSYLGCLLLGNRTFFDQIVKILEHSINRPISEIGNTDLTHTV
jgi:hypothetical protein